MPTFAAENTCFMMKYDFASKVIAFKVASYNIDDDIVKDGTVIH